MHVQKKKFYTTELIEVLNTAEKQQCRLIDISYIHVPCAVLARYQKC